MEVIIGFELFVARKISKMRVNYCNERFGSVGNGGDFLFSKGESQSRHPSHLAPKM